MLLAVIGIKTAEVSATEMLATCGPREWRHVNVSTDSVVMTVIGFYSLFLRQLTQLFHFLRLLNSLGV